MLGSPSVYIHGNVGECSGGRIRMVWSLAVWKGPDWSGWVVFVLVLGRAVRQLMEDEETTGRKGKKKRETG